MAPALLFVAGLECAELLAVGEAEMEYAPMTVYVVALLITDISPLESVTVLGGTVEVSQRQWRFGEERTT